MQVPRGTGRDQSISRAVCEGAASSGNARRRGRRAVSRAGPSDSAASSSMPSVTPSSCLGSTRSTSADGIQMDSTAWQPPSSRTFQVAETPWPTA